MFYLWRWRRAHACRRYLLAPYLRRGKRWQARRGGSYSISTVACSSCTGRRGMVARGMQFARASPILMFVRASPALLLRRRAWQACDACSGRRGIWYGGLAGRGVRGGGWRACVPGRRLPLHTSMRGGGTFTLYPLVRRRAWLQGTFMPSSWLLAPSAWALCWKLPAFLSDTYHPSEEEGQWAACYLRVLLLWPLALAKAEEDGLGLIIFAMPRAAFCFFHLFLSAVRWGGWQTLPTTPWRRVRRRATWRSGLAQALCADSNAGAALARRRFKLLPATYTASLRWGVRTGRRKDGGSFLSPAFSIQNAAGGEDCCGQAALVLSGICGAALRAVRQNIPLAMRARTARISPGTARLPLCCIWRRASPSTHRAEGTRVILAAGRLHGIYIALIVCSTLGTATDGEAAG